MRKYAVAVCFFALLPVLHAQPSSPARAMSIHDLTIGGTTHVSSADLAAIDDELKQQCCGRAETQEIRERIIYAFQQRGYCQARIQRIEVTPLDLHMALAAVEVSAEVNDGQQFRLKAIQFNGNEALASDQLRQQFSIQDGELFDVEKIRRGLESLRRLYASNGYINFVPVPNNDADEAYAVIKLTIDVDEGKQFHLAGLSVDGPEPHPGDRARLIEAGKPMVDKVYDGSKIEQWWQLAATMFPAGSSLEQALELKQDQATATITALLKFPEAQ